MAQEVKLKVYDASQEFTGKGVVTLGTSVKQELGLVSGDTIEIEGVRTTVAMVWPEKDPCEDNSIRMDKFTMHNAGVAVGDQVTIRKISPPQARKIVLYPLAQFNAFYQNYDLVIKKALLLRPFREGDEIPVALFGSNLVFSVQKTEPKGSVLLSDKTELIVNEKPLPSVPEPRVLGYEDIGGLDKELKTIRELVELPIKYPEYFYDLNISPPKGILLYGPPGTGKTLLAKAISAELKTRFFSIDAPQIMTKYLGEAEEKIRNIFSIAQKNSPSVIFIDEIDAIASKREGLASDVEKRVVAQLLASMDGIGERGEVIVIGATNRLEEIDQALRRPGRFDKEIEIPVADQKAREEILKVHTRNVPLDDDVSLKFLSEVTHGFVGADLSVLVKEAGLCAIRSAIKSTSPQELKLRKKDFDYALTVVQPSALREVFVETPQISLKDIGALKEQKEIFKDIVMLTTQKKELVERLGLKVPRSILLYGPPGTGKTFFVKGCAREFSLNFIYIKGPEILSKWVGQSEKAIRDIFKKARDVSPAIVFFDEIDCLAEEKGIQIGQPRVLDQLLTELDNLGQGIIFVSATNRPDLIDRALLRSGRIDKIIEFALPGKSERKEILELLLSKVPSSSKLDIDEIAELTENYTPADLNLLITESIILALKQSNYKEPRLTNEHIVKTLKKLKPSLSKEQLNYYEEFKASNKALTYIR